MKRVTLILSLITLLCVQGFSQIKVEGYVKNSEGVTLPGVSVVVKGSTIGTITNMDGFYSIDKVSKDATLVFSFIGMIQEEVQVGGQALINMILVEDILDLDEVVVVGYGSVKRANLTGAVSDIKAELLEDIPAGDLATTLQGRMAGVKIGNNTGKPGEAAKIQIRTSSSFGSVAENPLFVIDGIVYDNSSYNNTDDGQERFNQLDPSEIESISILKDAAAAVYGARSTAGVVLVKTKQGKEGKLSLSYNNSLGISQATSFPEMLSAYDHASMMNYIYANDETGDYSKYNTYTEDELEAYKNLNYNWIDEVWKPALINRQTLNVSGGNEKVQYFVGGSYYKESGHLENLEASKYSFRSNLTANIAKGLTAKLGISAGNNEKSEPYYADEESGYVLRDTYKRLLTAPKWIPSVIDGMPVANNMDYQPYGLLNSGSYESSTSNYSTVTGGLEYEVPNIPGLKMGVQYSYNSKSGFSKRYAQDYTVYRFNLEGTYRHIIGDSVVADEQRSNEAGMQEGASNSKSYQLNARISYGKTIGAHKFDAMFVYEQSESEGYGFNTTLTGVNVPGVEYMWAFNQNGIKNSPSASEGGRLGYIGRINYSFADKYIFEGTFRADASQKFHPDHRWGFFPAVSAGWIVSEEGFFQNNISFVNFFKVRGSVGVTGNDNVGAYKWKPSFSGNNTGVIFGDNILTNSIDVSNDGIISPTITWQKSNKYNIGIDARFLQSKLDLGFDYFYRLTYDILAKRGSTAPESFGAVNRPEENYGKMYAKGIEISLGYKDKITKDISYEVGGNFSWTKHRKLVVDQNPQAIGTWRDELINDPSNKPGYICYGIIRTEEDLAKVSYDSIDGEPVAIGQLWYADIRGDNYSEGPDGKINRFDNVIIAEYTNPPFNYGFHVGASWKDLRVDLTFTGEFGHKVLITKEEQALPTATDNVFAFWGDYWTPDNPNASMPRPYNYGQMQQNSTFWLRNGNTLKLNTINVNYTLPKELTSKVSIQQLKVYFTARNVWTIINPFDHKDPSVSRAYDYPMIRTFNFGLKLTI